MAVKKNTSSLQAKGRSTTAAASRKARESSGPMRAWSECSVTAAVSDDPPQFVKFTHGFEMMAKDDSRESMKAAEEHIYAACEEIVQKRIRKLTRLIRRLNG